MARVAKKNKNKYEDQPIKSWPNSKGTTKMESGQRDLDRLSFVSSMSLFIYNATGGTLEVKETVNRGDPYEYFRAADMLHYTAAYGLGQFCSCVLSNPACRYTAAYQLV
ncbi:hypothetical protein FB451DRAFT_1174896 [Mycena latifolia]|nr:hypothetical protein FB451DRAFT_1174896 [Mycena latifolia]